MSRLEIVITEGEIKTYISEIAAAIGAKYKGESVVLVGILKGSFIFIADLIREIERQKQLKDCYVDFLRYSSYGNERTSGEIRLEFDTSEPLAGKHVILVEDVADTLKTIHTAIVHLKTKNPLSVCAAAFIAKPDKHTFPATDLRFVGVNKTDAGYLVGYGMDDQGRGRGIPHVARVVD
jgi:hypoxanthine phosphoribosyltransferase